MVPMSPFWGSWLMDYFIKSYIVIYECTFSLFTQGGFYIMHLMDWYSAGYPLFVIALSEITAVIYIYGETV